MIDVTFEQLREHTEKGDMKEWIAESIRKDKIRQTLEDNSFTKIIEEVTEAICNKYCKYPDIWDAEKEGCELCDSEICANCPLSRLI